MHKFNTVKRPGALRGEAPRGARFQGAAEAAGALRGKVPRGACERAAWDRKNVKEGIQSK